MADDIQPAPAAKVAAGMTELGSTGLRRWAGQVDEEFLPQLRGSRAVKVYREMADNDAVVGAVLFAVEQLVRQVEWRVEPGDQSPEGLGAAQFVEECMHDMDETWEEFISEVISMLIFGWSFHEIVYKRRLGPSINPIFKSKHKDGRIGWRKMPIRSQDTLSDWDFADNGDVDGLIQMAPPNYQQVTIPMNKGLLFRTTQHKNNPEGRSVLRNAYRSWYLLKRMQEVEGIGVERDLAGMPVGRIPMDYLNALHDPDGDLNKRTVALAWQRLVTSVKRDEQEGILLPSTVDETGNREWDLELLSSGGTRQIDTDKIITRYEQRIAMTILSDFILLGHEAVGSYALATSKTGMFRAALQTWLRSVASVINDHELPRLFALNGWSLDALPEIIPADVETPSLEELGAFITALSGAGMEFFPDPTLEAAVRSMARLPEKDEQATVEQEVRREEDMLQQQQLAEKGGLPGQAAPGQVPPQFAGGAGEQDELPFGDDEEDDL